ncbi:MAG: hypothetical protein GY909_16740 [Oligoflexia bacterium]|nr:hypothetical protein [Oligoflexia bacterium]
MIQSETVNESSSENDQLIIEPELFQEIAAFETFLSKIGFKRIEGSIFGLLVLAKRPLTSDDIENALGLSQSAVSIAVKNLTHFGAIEVRESRDLAHIYPFFKDKRVKTYIAKEDSLNIVATVFRKREQETIEEFKAMAMRALNVTDDSIQEDPRKRRLKSIIATCEIAEAVMNFVIGLTQKAHSPFYDDIVSKLPKVLDFLSKGQEPLTQITTDIKNAFAQKLKEQISKKL